MILVFKLSSVKLSILIKMDKASHAASLLALETSPVTVLATVRRATGIGVLVVWPLPWSFCTDGGLIVTDRQPVSKALSHYKV